MNEAIDALRRRRSVRRYNGTSVGEDALRTVLEIGLTAPKGRNLKSVEFLVIRDHKTLWELSALRGSSSAMLEQAGAAVLVLGNESVTDVWMEDASVAMAYMHLAADALGLGSCWIQIWNRHDGNGNSLEPLLQERFGIPSVWRPIALLALGNTDSHLEGRSVSEEDWVRVHQETF